MISPLDSEIFRGLFGVDASIAREFDDRRRIADLLEVEAALARAEAAVGVIPQQAAEAIASASATLDVDVAALQRSVASSAVPTIEIVRQLRAAVGPAVAPFVHRGATSQDIVDTAAVLAWRRAQRLIDVRLHGLARALAGLADRHRRTVMAGRTHGQHASPVTFGLKAANWLAPVTRHWRRLEALKLRLFAVQLGGASGTLAALGERGLDVLEAFARELDLQPRLPWHTQRDIVVEYGQWLTNLAASVGKMGQDVILLTHTEVAEAAESSDPSAGASSTMPHKANPIASEMMVAAARATAALQSALYAAAIQEHERSTHGWQLEWQVLPQMIALTYGSVSLGAGVASALDVFPVRMTQNVQGAGDLTAGEALVAALAPAMAPEEAQSLVARAAREVRGSGASLVDAVRRAALQRGIDRAIPWAQLADPATQVGLSDALIDRILTEARAAMSL